MHEISRLLHGLNAIALLSKTHHDQWKARRGSLVGEAVQDDINGYFVFRVAGVMELFGYDAEAARLRALAHLTGATKPAYCFHDPEYVDTVIVHESDSEVE